MKKLDSKWVALGVVVYLLVKNSKKAAPVAYQPLTTTDFNFNYNDAIMRSGGLLPDVSTGLQLQTTLDWYPNSDPSKVAFTNMVMEPHGGIPDFSLLSTDKLSLLG